MVDKFQQRDAAIVAVRDYLRRAGTDPHEVGADAAYAAVGELVAAGEADDAVRRWHATVSDAQRAQFVADWRAWRRAAGAPEACARCGGAGTVAGRSRPLRCPLCKGDGVY